MLKWAIIFFVIPLIAGLFGYTGISSAAAGVAKFLFSLFVALVVMMLMPILLARKKVRA
jgi:uncharacterized membrane protein YtjA (UPF0391 family)